MALIISNFGCWRLGASLQFRFGLEWQAWLPTGVFFSLLRLNFTAWSFPFLSSFFLVFVLERQQ